MGQRTQEIAQSPAPSGSSSHQSTAAVAWANCQLSKAALPCWPLDPLVLDSSNSQEVIEDVRDAGVGLRTLAGAFSGRRPEEVSRERE